LKSLEDSHLELLIMGPQCFEAAAHSVAFGDCFPGEKSSRMFYRVEQGLSKTRRDEIVMGPGMHEWAMGWPRGTDRYGYSYRYAAHE